VAITIARDDGKRWLRAKAVGVLTLDRDERTSMNHTNTGLTCVGVYMC
jgi:hypothetical protein